MQAKASRVPVGAEEGREDPASGGLRLGRIVAVDKDHHILVELDGSTDLTVARLAIAADRQRVDRAIAEREVTVLGFEDGDPRRPIVLGLIPLSATRALTALAPPPHVGEVIQADVDGRRVRIEAQDEIVFRCGKASVTLRRNGKVVIRGTHVETDSEGTNRIKGGQVRIN
jgi:Domain of unknown function (DUF6484)